jgi:Proteobacterial transcriptional regulator-like domain
VVGAREEWQPREAYRYVASLDGPLLAWEYLRRNVQYHADRDRRTPVSAEGVPSVWGLLQPDRPQARGT